MTIAHLRSIVLPFDADEAPTRPDWPNTVARRCKHCGRVYGDHAEIFPLDVAAECFGVRANYEPEDHADGDAER